jgi:hypothetical protein
VHRLLELPICVHSFVVVQTQSFLPLYSIIEQHGNMHLMYVEEDGKRKYTLKKVLGKEMSIHPTELVLNALQTER